MPASPARALRPGGLTSAPARSPPLAQPILRGAKELLGGHPAARRGLHLPLPHPVAGLPAAGKAGNQPGLLLGPHLLQPPLPPLGQRSPNARLALRRLSAG